MFQFRHQFLTLFLLATATYYATADDDDEEEKDELFTSDNKMECVNKMVNWCDNMKYPKEGTGMAMISIATTDSSGKYWRVFCTSDSDGTNCTRNGSPWVSCSSDHKMIYNDAPLSKDSVDNVDNGICNATKMAFNDVFIQNLSYNPLNISLPTGMNKDFEHFFKVLADMEAQMEILRKRIFGGNCFPFCNPYNPSDNGNSATELPDSSSNEASNDLERE